jgi:aconitate decarboxylase
MTDAVWAFAHHVANTRLEDVPAEAVVKAKTYLLDSLGVGVVGSAAPWVDELIESQAIFGFDPAKGSARVLAGGQRLAAPSAALANAFQIHNSEFDCVHEGAVVHPMAVILGAMGAYADAKGGIPGREFLTALISGIDVAAGLGVASNAPLKFFRPATAGGFGAAAALARLKGLDAAGIVRSMSAAYGQMGGTMQAHTEGKGLLAMQVGFNARNALIAAEMAERNVDAPVNVLEGPYGYFANFEGDHDVQGVVATLGKIWRITEVAHKPFPSGRATHGLVDGVLQLLQKHAFSADDVESVESHVPSLTQRLIGRPSKADMTPNYARLSGQYVVASTLISGSVGVEDFYPAALAASDRLALANKVKIEIDNNPDPNALAPITVAIRLRNGQKHEIRLNDIYGAPANPMTEAAHLAKFQKNFASARPAVPPSQGDALIDAVANIEDVPDVRLLIDLCIAPAVTS